MPLRSLIPVTVERWRQWSDHSCTKFSAQPSPTLNWCQLTGEGREVGCRNDSRVRGIRLHSAVQMSRVPGSHRHVPYTSTDGHPYVQPFVRTPVSFLDCCLLTGCCFMHGYGLSAATGGKPFTGCSWEDCGAWWNNLSARAMFPVKGCGLTLTVGREDAWALSRDHVLHWCGYVIYMNIYIHDGTARIEMHWRTVVSRCKTRETDKLKISVERRIHIK